MELEDRVTFATPEGVSVEVTLAGLGSRAIAAVADSLLKLAITIALVIPTLGLSLSGSQGGFALQAAVVLAIFLVSVGYDIAFETLAGGRTPGKRWTGIRVVRDGGRPVGFLASSIRNVVRFVDSLPAGYLAGVVAILASERNKRLGDMAAGTIVIRDRVESAAARPVPYSSEAAAATSAWDVTAVTQDEVAVVRSFLARRKTLDETVRSKLAWELAERLRPKVVGAATDDHPEEFLQKLAAAKSSRG